MGYNIDSNRAALISELQSVQRPGIEGLISFLDKIKFFDAQCHNHDATRGGTVNHSLWVLKFARETRNEIFQNNPQANIPEDSLVLSCLLHDICDACHGDGHGRLSASVLKGLHDTITFSKAELKAVNFHMHSSMGEGAHRSSRNSHDSTELLHYILHNSDGRAIEYAAGIPFDEEPIETVVPHICDEKEELPIYYDPQKNCYWWDEIYRCFGHSRVDLTNCVESLASIYADLYISQWPLEAEVCVMKNKGGKYALFYLAYLSGMGCPTTSYSDSNGFDYVNFVFYLSRYPQNRPSYIVAQKSNGKWGVLAVKDHQGDHNFKFVITVKTVTPFIYNTADDAVNNMRHGKFRIRVRHTGFYEKYVCER